MNPLGKNQHKFYIHFQSLQQTLDFCASVFAAEVKEMKYHISCPMLISFHIFLVSYSCFLHGFSAIIPSFVSSSQSLLLVLFCLFWLSSFWIKSMFNVLFNKNNTHNFFFIYALPHSYNSGSLSYTWTSRKFFKNVLIILYFSILNSFGTHCHIDSIW